MVQAHSFGNIFQGRKTEQENGGKGEEEVEEEEEMPLRPSPDKQKLNAFTGVERGRGGRKRELENRGGR